MGAIADRVRQMRGCSLAQIVAEIEAMEEAALNVGASDFDAFWNVWPHKVGKPVAKKAYMAARKKGYNHAQIIEGVTRYIRSKPTDRPWLNPSTFLNQERFNDEPATLSAPAHRASNLDLLEQELAERIGNGSRGQRSPDFAAVPRISQR